MTRENDHAYVTTYFKSTTHMLPPCQQTNSSWSRILVATLLSSNSTVLPCRPHDNLQHCPLSAQRDPGAIPCILRQQAIVVSACRVEPCHIPRGKRFGSRFSFGKTPFPYCSVASWNNCSCGKGTTTSFRPRLSNPVPFHVGCSKEPP